MFLVVPIVYSSRVIFWACLPVCLYLYPRTPPLLPPYCCFHESQIFDWNAQRLLAAAVCISPRSHSPRAILDALRNRWRTHSSVFQLYLQPSGSFFMRPGTAPVPRCFHSHPSPLSHFPFKNTLGLDYWGRPHDRLHGYLIHELGCFQGPLIHDPFHQIWSTEDFCWSVCGKSSEVNRRVPPRSPFLLIFSFTL